MMLTPNLTPTQTARLMDALSRMTGLPSAPALYVDADRIAGRWMLAPHHDHDPATVTIATLVQSYHVPPGLAGYVAGLALGVRLGRSFPAPRRRPLSVEYARLAPEQRRDVDRLIREMATGRGMMTFLSYDVPVTTKASSPPEDDLAAATKWARQAGVQARAR